MEGNCEVVSAQHPVHRQEVNIIGFLKKAELLNWPKVWCGLQGANGNLCCKGDVQGIYLNVLNVLKAVVPEPDLCRQPSIHYGQCKNTELINEVGTIESLSLTNNKSAVSTRVGEIQTGKTTTEGHTKGCIAEGDHRYEQY
jgi:hypothetical protein